MNVDISMTCNVVLVPGSLLVRYVHVLYVTGVNIGRRDAVVSGPSAAAGCVIRVALNLGSISF